MDVNTIINIILQEHNEVLLRENEEMKRLVEDLRKELMRKGINS